MVDLAHDFLHGLRGLLANPVFTVATTVSVAIGVAANTTVFSAMNMVLFRPLAGVETERLVRIGATLGGRGHLVVSYPEYLDIRDATSELESLAAYRVNDVVIRLDERPREAGVELVSANYFSALGVPMLLVRGFDPSLDVTARAAVTVLGHALWQGGFGADPEVIGQTIRVAGLEVTVVGVATEDFIGTFPGFEVQLWLPLAMHDQVLQDRGSITDRHDPIVSMIGRMRQGATVASAQAELNTLARVLENEAAGASNRRGLTIAPARGVHPMMAAIARPFLTLLLAIVSLLLLIACANVATLQLARATARRKEIAIRMALGAGRGRVVGQLLTESLALASIGGGAALLLTHWAAGAISRFDPGAGIPVRAELQVDLRVTAFALAATLLTGFLFGLGPALFASRTDLVTAMKGLPSTGRRPMRLRTTLVVVQIALTTVLLVGTGLLGQSILRAAPMRTGFDSDRILIAHGDPSALRYTDAATQDFWSQFVDSSAALPTIERAELALFVPLGRRSDRLVAFRSGVESPASPSAYQYNAISPGYLDLLGIDIVRGRPFGRNDSAEAEPVTIINETLVRRLWPRSDPIGEAIVVIDRGAQERLLRIVGIAQDSVYRRLGEPPTPFIYLPVAQWRRADLVLHARSMPGATNAATELRAAAARLEPDLPMRIATMAGEMRSSLLITRVLAVVVSGSGVVGLLLAATGLFGLVAYVTEQRLHEIGVRTALGATSRQISRLVLGHAVRIVAIGLTFGLAAAATTTRLLASFLYGVGSGDPATFVGIALVLIATSLAAGFLPARRAAGLDPLTVLRRE